MIYTIEFLNTKSWMEKKSMDDLGGTPMQNHHTLALMKTVELDVGNHVPSGNLK